MKFAGRNVIVTGASLGIGRACAIELARRGANVGLNFRSNVEQANAVVREIEGFGQKAILLQGDVADQSFVEQMVETTAEEFGGLDMYVSNAAYSDRQRMIAADMGGFRRTIDVSMWGAFYGVRAAAQQMVKQGNGGAITVLSSPHAVIPIPTAMAYNMAKAAIDHMARTAAIELAEYRIRVNLVHPGWIDTPGERKFFSEEAIQKGSQKLPWGRLGTPEEIAKAVAYTLSDDADYMTGSTLTIDGGVSLPWWSNRDSGEQ
ncbi:MAG: SDR family oxidoreductase [Planctomycetota bacterium]|nr:SDR family oxidoreductase [Planctomycetota bacterium]MDA1163194.1 SDR family oxidoreductase [Planctomycetota bacterium]